MSTQSGKLLKAVVARPFPMHVQVVAGQTYMWCACGLSKKQPFCDGSHKGTDLRPVKWTATVTKKVNFCMCKTTKSQPLCDLSHVPIFARMHGPKIAGFSVAGAAAAIGVYQFFR